ncbi:MAG: hypothetical protein ACYSUQ_13335, partial [Planctomycetota bacterium]
MWNGRQPARINARALVILALVTVVLAGGAAVVYKVRRRTQANRALNSGKEALAREDWPEACRQLKLYLSKNPDDLAILPQYAVANLSVRPTDAKHVSAAA